VERKREKEKEKESGRPAQPEARFCLGTNGGVVDDDHPANKWNDISYIKSTGNIYSFLFH
jgi:hypothetical protein